MAKQSYYEGIMLYVRIVLLLLNSRFPLCEFTLSELISLHATYVLQKVSTTLNLNHMPIQILDVSLCYTCSD